jgi:hypothetical protein
MRFIAAGPISGTISGYIIIIAFIVSLGLINAAVRTLRRR